MSDTDRIEVLVNAGQRDEALDLVDEAMRDCAYFLVDDGFTDDDVVQRVRDLLASVRGER